MTNVLFVPDISQNLLSVAQIVQKGYSLIFKNDSCIISDHCGTEIMIVSMKNKSFYVECSNLEMHAHSASLNESVLWHKRLGYLSYATLEIMSTMKLAESLPSIHIAGDVCDVCQYGKSKRLPFPANKAWRASNRLQLVHTDVCGPQKTQSLSGSRYFILFIDDFTRFTWIYFLKFKSEVAAVFLKFKALVENQADCKIKILRSDNETEYTSDQFERFCYEAGIEHQLTVIYTPQQNGVSERKNRTVMEMSRCLLFEKKLPKSF